MKPVSCLAALALSAATCVWALDPERATSQYVIKTWGATSLGSNTGAMIKIAARGTRTMSNASNAIKADISVDLSMKSA